MPKIEDYAVLGDLHTAALMSTAGSVDWLRLRFDYGRIVPWVRNHGTRGDAIAGPDRVAMASAVPMHGHDWETLADFTVRQDDRVWFVMSWAPGHEPEMSYVDAEQALAETTDFGPSESTHAAYQTGPYSEAVDRSLITLKALTYEPRAASWRPAAFHPLQDHGVGCWPDGTIGTHVRPPWPGAGGQLCDQVHHDVVTYGFDTESNTFTQAYGSTALDTSLLLIPRVGYLPSTDPRVLCTIAAIRRELSEGGLLRVCRAFPLRPLDEVWGAPRFPP